MNCLYQPDLSKNEKVNIVIILLLLLGAILLLIFNRLLVIPYLLLYYIASSSAYLLRRRLLGKELLVIHDEEPGYYKNMYRVGLIIYGLVVILLIFLAVVQKDPVIRISLLLGLIALALMAISYRTFRRRVICAKGISSRETGNLKWQDIDSLYWSETKDHIVIFLTKTDKDQFLRRHIINIDEPARNEAEIVLRKLIMEHKIKEKIS